MENRFDKISAKLTDRELQERIENPKIFEPEAVVSAMNELKKRSGETISFEPAENYLEEQEKKKKAQADAQLDEQKIIDEYERQIKGKMANFWERLLAYILDIAIAIVPYFFILGSLFSVLEIRYQETRHYVYQTIGMLIWLMYFVFWESSNLQATPGKLLLKLKVVNKKGHKINVGTAILRFFSRILSALIVGIGFLMILTNPRKRALHDILSKTAVVKRKRDAFDRSTLLDYEMTEG